MKIFKRQMLVIAGLTLSLGMGASIASATHSWGGYHWARTANPFTVKLGDNVSTVWDSHLAVASTDWSASSVLDTTIVSGTSKRNCGPVKGRVEVCNKNYGNNGWLGIASIWVSGSHITQGTVKLNDTYFNTATYNTPAWRRFVMCQEVGHTFGLGHQDETFNNPNLGTCMDYTSDPDGTLANPDQLSNEHPNTHDYDELVGIYAHLDTFTTLLSKTFSAGGSNMAKAADVDTSDAKEWGKALKHDSRGKDSLYERNLGNGEKLFTFVVWAK
ncbi:MAG: hypothetical protein HYZ69_03755 [Candidatus Colwellbacteria bacterium]|nr:hypothetical protein [Candidatus Colwellbacteria bacterium]